MGAGSAGPAAGAPSASARAGDSGAGGFAPPGAGATGSGATGSGVQGLFTNPQSQSQSGTGGSGFRRRGFGGGGFGGPGGFGGAGGPGGAFGGDSTSLNAAVTYAKTHGGGAIGVESQSTASAAILANDADVAGLGGFSGRESTVSAQWLAMEVRTGRLRWLVDDGSGGFGGFGGDSRQGSRAAMAIAERVGKKVTVTSNGTTITMYDLQGRASAILAAAGRS